jgi:hypothetical protein
VIALPPPSTKEKPTDWPRRRAALIKQLSTLERGQLVIVRYPYPDWDVLEEWVYNDADIDKQRVIFAHDFGDEENRKLLAYYPDRTVWLLTFDTKSGQEDLEPYASPHMQLTGDLTRAK